VLERVFGVGRRRAGPEFEEVARPQGNERAQFKAPPIP
jgi:hypothetical protein